MSSSTHSAGDETVILANDNSNNVTINLPQASTVRDRMYYIKRTDTNPSYSVAVDAYGSEEIDGSSSAQYVGEKACIQIVCDGSNWHIIGDE